MNRPVNSGKRVESIDRVDRFSVELSRFVRLDRFQGLTNSRSRASVNSTARLRAVGPEEEKSKLRRGGFAEKEGFGRGMIERKCAVLLGVACIPCQHGDARDDDDSIDRD